MLELSERQDFRIGDYASFFSPLSNFNPKNKPKNLHEEVDPFLRHPITRELIGYAEINSILKFFFPAWDMIMNPQQALENEEHIGSLTWIFTPLVPLAIFLSLLGSKLLDKAQDNKAYYVLYAFSCIIRWPLMGLGLFFNALSQLTLYLTAISLVVAFVAIGAALVVGLSPLIALGIGLFYALDKAPMASDAETNSPKIEEEEEELSSLVPSMEN